MTSIVRILPLLLLLSIFSCKKKNDDLDASGSKIVLQTNVIDAEYNRKTNRLVYVSSSPNRLSVFDTQQKKIRQVDLTYAPLSVSIAPDGKTAVVGHDAHLSHIDLTGNRVIREFDTSCEVQDVVLAGNGWAYAFPKRDQWSAIRCLELTTGKETLSVSNVLYAGAKAKLHPSGRYIYTADNFISPDDVKKFDIQNGTARLLYDSPYHGDYPMTGDLWFSEDGSRLFTRGRTVLKITEDKATDMTYNGTVPADTTVSPFYIYRNIVSLDQHEGTGRIYYVSRGDQPNAPNRPYISVHQSKNLRLDRKIDMESFTYQNASGKTVKGYAEPVMVFCNAGGLNIFVISRSVKGAATEWAITTF